MLEQVFAETQGGDRVLIRTISDSHTRSEKLVERCAPQCGAVGTVQRLFYCSDGRLRTDSGAVRRDIISALKNRLTKFEELEHSDILRTIATVAREDTRKGSKLRLFIFSDLIENSDYFPGKYLFTYPNTILVAWLKKYSLLAKLDETRISVAGVGRAGTSDRRPLTVAELQKLTEFWRFYFEASGAETVVIGQNAPAPR